MESLTVTTPTHSTTPEIHTPNTPKHGFSDSWEPYSPRKSARISQRNTSINRTPSPRAAPRQPERNQLFGSPRTKKNYLSTNTSTSMASPTSPQKKRMPAMDSTRRVSGNLTLESTATATAALGYGAKNTDSRTGRASFATGAGLLPTPAKTPQKTPSPKTKANINAVRRNLFHQDEADVVPTPKRTRGKKHVLDSFADNDDDESFPIFTDSRERIPEVDPNEDNPFYCPTNAAVPEAPRRRSKRQHVTIPGEGKITVEEAVKREDGMLIVFRGKKQFRKFADMEEASGSMSEVLDSADGGLDAAVESRLRRPMTRSSIKPRLLFPVPAAPVQAPPANIDDEEAETDIEDNTIPAKDEMDIEQEEHPHTPFDLAESPDTPVAPKFAPTMPVSPPTTQRTTRHGTKSADETTPMKPLRGGKRSPFDGWRRTKNGGSSEGGGGSAKRSGESLTADAAKRSRA
ncbi:hypothetical protein CONLIGDRAFT_656860 [Coniochaeta ligniaria NRRL 30616]|uniref:Uncharacterized protein n=1 Tax=Coniochaeta ligniaria NRRL 30616 TaxID=1408157 RepID=A0A1J7ID06_9PEZI|nr:hypothetical protein CONLIGDRAFT_656860 [Coniochaeta ligniaria NRRL 30616]